MDRSLLIVIAGLACWGTTAGVRGQTPVRFLEIGGNINIRAADGKERPATVYGAAEDGERLLFSAQSSAVLAWPASGQLQRIAGTGEAVVREQTVEVGAGLTASAIEPPNQELVVKGVRALGGLPQGATTLSRSVKDRPVRPSIAPILGSTVLSVEPSFSWPPKKDAVQYRVRLNSSEGVLWEKQAQETTVTYPSPKPLERGLQYQWVVSAAVPNQAEQLIAEGEFTVAVEEEAKEAKELQTLASAQDEFLLAIVALRLEQQDLIAEAISVYEKLAQLSAKTPAYHAALSELYDKAGRPTQANAARQRATQLGFRFE